MTPERLLALFGARLDDFATQTSDGGYRRMGRPVTIADAARHLAGTITIGLYQLNAQGEVLWLCLDLDVAEREWLRQLYNAAVELGVPEAALLEEFSGNKGYHLWCFFSEPVPAALARRLGEVIVAKSGVPTTDPQYTHPDGRLRELIEIYPKTLDLSRTDKGMGQLVKLPLGIHRKSGKLAEPIDVRHRVEGMTPEALATLLVPWAQAPLAPTTHSNGTAPLVMAPGRGHRDLVPCTEGMLEAVWGEGGRNAAIFNLAKRLNAAGWSEQETTDFLLVWAPTHTSPPTGIAEIKSTAHSGMRYTGMNCLDPAIVPFCKATCPIYMREHPATGGAGNGEGPVLRVTSTVPAIYTLPLSVGEVIMTGENILNWDKVREAAANQLPTATMMLPRRARQDWERELDAIMLTKKVIETPEVTSPPGVVRSLLQSWLARASDDPDQVEKRNVWMDEEDRVFVFQGDALIRYIQNIERGTDRALIWQVVQQSGGVERERVIPGDSDKEVKVWEIPIR